MLCRAQAGLANVWERVGECLGEDAWCSKGLNPQDVFHPGQFLLGMPSVAEEIYIELSV